MSLIFEALKKADAARARMQGGQPALQEEVLARSAAASPVSVFDPQAPLRPAAPPAWARPRVAIWLVAGVVALGVLMLVFGPARRDGAAVPAAAPGGPGSPGAPGQSTPAGGPGATPAPMASPAPAPAPAPAPSPLPGPPPAREAAARPPAKAAPVPQPAAKSAPSSPPPATQTPPSSPQQATKGASPPLPARSASAAPGATAAAATPAAPAPGPAAVPNLADLPPDLRASMPRLSVSGAVYSPDPSARMLLVNGQVLREGDTVAPGLVLERIGPRQAVLSWQGTRFQMKL